MISMDKNGKRIGVKGKEERDRKRQEVRSKGCEVGSGEGGEKELKISEESIKKNYHFKLRNPGTRVFLDSV